MSCTPHDHKIRTRIVNVKWKDVASRPRISGFQSEVKKAVTQEIESSNYNVNENMREEPREAWLTKDDKNDVTFFKLDMCPITMSLGKKDNRSG